MNKQNGLTLNGISTPHILLVLSSIGMMGSSLYLLAHFFQTFFPQGISGGDLCNMSGFFSCDAVAYSPVAQIFGIPIALFGLLAGAFLFLSSLFPSEERESTNHLLARINFAGCLILFLYSIAVLKHLCPVCTLYYIFSGIIAFLFWRNSDSIRLDYKTISIYAVITLVCVVAIKVYINYKNGEQNKMAQVMVDGYLQYPNLGEPPESPYKIYQSTPKFSDAPIRISIFSDFQCPACKILSETMPRLIARYQGKINIQYFFYPLDSNCNPNMERPMHEMACRLSYFSSCLPEKFPEIHDAIFQSQDKLDESFLKNLLAVHPVTDCMNDPKTKDKIIELIKTGDPYNIRSTPTMILNGVKIEGVHPLSTMIAIMDYLANAGNTK